jgi:hypothetical protein
MPSVSSYLSSGLNNQTNGYNYMGSKGHVAWREKKSCLKTTIKKASTPIKKEPHKQCMVVSNSQTISKIRRGPLLRTRL